MLPASAALAQLAVAVASRGTIPPPSGGVAKLNEAPPFTERATRMSIGPCGKACQRTHAT